MFSSIFCGTGDVWLKKYIILDVVVFSGIEKYL